MKISELVAKLREISDEHGDIQVYTVQLRCGEYLKVENTYHWKDGESIAVELNLDWSQS